MADGVWLRVSARPSERSGQGPRRGITRAGAGAGAECCQPSMWRAFATKRGSEPSRRRRRLARHARSCASRSRRWSQTVPKPTHSQPNDHHVDGGRKRARREQGTRLACGLSRGCDARSQGALLRAVLPYVPDIAQDADRGHTGSLRSGAAPAVSTLTALRSPVTLPAGRVPRVGVTARWAGNVNGHRVILASLE